MFPSFVLFSYIHFWLTDPKSFLKVPLAPTITTFEGEARAEKSERAHKYAKRVFLLLFESSENQFIQPNIFLKQESGFSKTFSYVYKT